MRKVIDLECDLPPVMDKLIDRAGVALEIADQLLVLPASLECRETEFLVELHRLGHRADAERIGSQLVERHRPPP